ncbi:MAG: heme exporter protein CcmB [bacterium]
MTDVRMWPAFTAILRRDLLIAARNPGEVANPILFFLMVVSMVPLALSPDPARLAAIAPGILWVMALLASLLSLDNLFSGDFRDGVLEQMMISPQPVYVMVLAKVLAHWLVTGLPLTLFAPVLGVMLSLPADGFVPLVLGLMLGTQLFSLIGAIGAALTVALRRGGLLISLIVMPLYVPVLIFGASAVQRSVEGFPVQGQLALLGAMLAFAIVAAPFAAAGALRVSLHG